MIESTLKLATLCKLHNLTIVTAESCTTGLIASSIADKAGSSEWLDSAFITYTPDAKNKVLSVPYETIRHYDIVSEEVAQAMAEGAKQKRPGHSIYLSTTGYAGPGGGTADIPVGTVCFAWLYKLPEIKDLMLVSKTVFFKGGRNEIRKKAADLSISETVAFLDNFYK